MTSTELSITKVVTDNLLKAMNKLMLEDTTLGYESELKKLQGSVSSINEVLLNALKNEEHLTNENRRCIERIKDVIYEADDVVDELHAVNYLKKYGKPTSRIKSLFSSTSGMIKGVRKQCQDIGGMYINIHPSERIISRESIFTREDTYSYLYAPNVIGRDNDVETVVKMLIYGNCSIVSIIGMGGLGKTTVAQLVFNQTEVVNTFTKRVWVCVGFGECFNFEAICDKILRTGILSEKSLNADGDSSVRVLCQLLQETRFLLVLDDVWSENYGVFYELSKLFEGGKGSRILFTTRFRAVEKAIQVGLVHELEGLSEDDSWQLFASTAFDEGQERDSQLVEIGRNIAAQCANVPLALKVTGSLLYGQHRHKWLACQESIWDNTWHDSSTLFSILKLSYYQLETLPLKCCFTFCALFPKGFQIQKDLLLSLWMAQGYIQLSPYGTDSIDDLAEKYFTDLLERGFFQDVERNEYGDIVSCRIHDLMHVLAKQLAGEELSVVKISANISAKVHHVFHDAKHNKEVSFGKTKTRTYLLSGFQGQFPVATVVANCKSLRALGLYDLDDISLLDSIGKLIHLRYLDLSKNKELQKLPRSLTELCYLETLVLRGCSKLKELPSDLTKLTSLRCLDILGCELLSRMPSDMYNLTRLRTLTLFVMDDGDSSGKLTDLQNIKGLKGCIEILIPAKYTADGNHIFQMDNFKAVSLHFQKNDTVDRDSTFLEKLQPHAKLEGLTLKGYQGSVVHCAAIEKLVKLELISCEGLKHLSFLSKLGSLKSLILQNLLNLEYIEDASSTSASWLHEPKFLHSLEYLDISKMSSLEKWWGKADLLEGRAADSFKSKQLVFESLSHLRVESCPKLLSFPPCPKADKLYLTGLNATLSLFDLCPEGHLWAKEMEVDDIGYLKSLATSNEKVHTYNNLQKLKIGACSVPSSHSTMEESGVGDIKGDEDDEPWKLLHKSLQTLELDSLEKMVNLPEGMQHLTSLQHLIIKHCNNLKVIPEWISCLASLESLCIISCTGLKLLPESMRKLVSLRHLEIQGHTYLQKRCQPIHGEDWPKIQHIRSISAQQSL
ncbi:putative disease resistance protein RGA1 [Silene latifolia]|uniref:putative disease resistance protein RGA1 n=1 Tax=Silene latifolia TaxID=37657 RepID=UPI003D76D2F7